MSGLNHNMEIHGTKQIFRKFGIVESIEISSVTSETSFNIETLHGWRYNGIKHVVCHDPIVKIKPAYCICSHNAPNSADPVES